MAVGRRAFIKGSVAAAVTTVAGTGRARAALLALPPPNRVHPEEHRVVIIGSGFGGGVSALRLAEAGVRDIVVLERGKRWPTGPNALTFPDAEHLDQRLLWYGSVPTVLPGLLPRIDRPVLPTAYAGLLEAHVGPNMSVLNAAGVGGGSIVYQGMTLQPARAVFEEVFPSGLDYDLLDRVHYPRVARMLQIETAPDELVESPSYLAPRIFRRNALAAGYSVDKIPMPIDWDFALAELRGEMRPSYTNGNCFMGVNNGGKHSVDVTYIAQAEATGGVDVRPLHNVTRIGRAGNGRWTIEVEQTDVHGTVIANKLLTTPTLILAAGSPNTTKMLLRARHEGTIPDLPDAVGTGWGSNGDRIVAWTNPDEGFGPVQGGPVVFGSKEWDDPTMANTVIQASLPPLGVDAHTTVVVGFGVSEVRATWVYNPLLDSVMVDWPREGDAALHRRVWERMTAIAGPRGVLVDTHTPAPMTWHSLGGACMGTVCDLEGRVHDNPGLYVLDGALMPGSTAACNPSMTIAAIAERAMDVIVRDDVGTRI
jgi:cholesterol oxidase